MHAGERIAWPRHVRFLLLLVLGAAVLLVWTWIVPGPLSIDEVTYHRMTHDLVRGHGFLIRNGYEALGSPELGSMFVRVTGEGHLAAQYPYGAPVLAAPFYAVFGPRGMFLVNAIAFAVALALTYRLAVRMCGDHVIAIVASGLLISTYFTEYALASWPHASAVAAALGAFSLSVEAHLAGEPRRSALFSLAAGLVMGLGVALRLDVLLCLGALAAPFVFSSPMRIRSFLAILLGCIPGAAFIVASNYARWRRISPLSYGPKAEMWDFSVFILVGGVLVAAAWVMTRRRARPWTSRHARLIAGFSLLCVLALLASIPSVRHRVSFVSQGVLGLFADLRVLPSQGMHFLDSRAVTIDDDFKKALLQSCPFVGLAALAVARGIGKQRDRLTAIWLAAVPATVLVFFGAFAWHGGIALNLRYALPALPFLCILVASAVRDLAGIASRPWVSPMTAAFVATLILQQVLTFWIPRNEEVTLSVPLVLGAALVIAAHIAFRQQGPRAAVVALALLGSTVAWSADATVRDVIWSHDRRASYGEVSAMIGPRLPANALLFAEFADPFYGVIEYQEEVAIAIPYLDKYEDMPHLLRRQLRRGGRVFGAFRPTTWDSLRSHGILNAVTTRFVYRAGPYVLAEIQPTETDKTDRP